MRIIFILLFFPTICFSAESIPLSISIGEDQDVEIKENIDIRYPDVKTIKVFSKPKKGCYVLIHNGKTIFFNGYVERTKIYSGNTIFYGTQLEVEEEIKRLNLSGPITINTSPTIKEIRR